MADLPGFVADSLVPVARPPVGRLQLISPGQAWQAAAGTIGLTGPDLELLAQARALDGGLSEALTARGIEAATVMRTLASWIPAGLTDAPSVPIVVETGGTPAAGAVGPGAAKPVSTLTYAVQWTTVGKAATVLVVSEELLGMTPAMESVLDVRLLRLLFDAVDQELIQGPGTTGRIRGFHNTPGLGTPVVRTGGDTNADAIAKAIAQLTTAGAMADAIVMHPTNWTATLTADKGAPGYYDVDPATGAPVPTLWGLPVLVTPGQILGTALVGAFQIASQIFWRSVGAQASRSHSDLFTKDMAAIRAEARLALAVYRPSAFVEVTALTAPA